MIISFIVAFIVLIIIIVILCLVGLLTGYFIAKDVWVDENTIFISFKQFKSLYQIAPDKWRLEDTYVVYRIDKPGIKYHKITENCFFKHFIDYIQYKIFLNKYKKEREEHIRNNNLVVTLVAWQRDIDEYRQKSLEELKAEQEKIDREISKYRMEKII